MILPYVYIGLTSPFFKKSFWGHMCLIWGHWYPCFGFLVTTPLGFKARVGSALFACFVEANVMYIPRSTSGATPADLLTVNIAANHFLTCISRGWMWLKFERAITQTEDYCATYPA